MIELAEKQNQQVSQKFFAVVRVRGLRGVRWKVRLLLEKMRLTRKNHCVLLKDGESLRGMLQKAKDYVTWGEASEATVALLEKKGKPPYALHPARQGMGWIKKRFPEGALGYRGEAINQLIARMA